MSNTEPNRIPSSSTSQAEPEPGTSNKENELADLTHIFSPEIVHQTLEKQPKLTEERGKLLFKQIPPQRTHYKRDKTKSLKKLKGQRRTDKKKKEECFRKVLQSDEESNDDNY